MYTSIYQNSYVVFVIVLILLSLFFYLFEIGYTSNLSDGKIVKKFNWKYPLAISLIVWLLWYFYFFPPQKNKKTLSIRNNIDNNTSSDQPLMLKNNNAAAQKITLANWN